MDRRYRKSPPKWPLHALVPDSQAGWQPRAAAAANCAKHTFSYICLDRRSGGCKTTNETNTNSYQFSARQLHSQAAERLSSSRRSSGKWCGALFLVFDLSRHSGGHQRPRRPKRHFTPIFSQPEAVARRPIEQQWQMVRSTLFPFCFRRHLRSPRH